MSRMYEWCPLLLLLLPRVCELVCVGRSVPFVSFPARDKRPYFSRATPTDWPIAWIETHGGDFSRDKLLIPRKDGTHRQCHRSLKRAPADAIAIFMLLICLWGVRSVLIMEVSGKTQPKPSASFSEGKIESAFLLVTVQKLMRIIESFVFHLARAPSPCSFFLPQTGSHRPALLPAFVC